MPDQRQRGVEARTKACNATLEAETPTVDYNCSSSVCSVFLNMITKAGSSPLHTSVCFCFFVFYYKALASNIKGEVDTIGQANIDNTEEPGMRLMSILSNRLHSALWL